MTQSIIRYAGSFRFRDHAVLERALACARSRIDDDAELAALEGGWLRCFTIADGSVKVALALPAIDQHRLAATEVFALLSREALDGSVIASINNVPVEYYTVKPWLAS